MELPACPVETTLMLIGDKWKVLILRDLMSGTKRFGELKKSIGHVTQKVLTAQLRDMEAKGLLTRKVYAETVRYFAQLRAAGIPAALDIYHTDLHAFDMMQPKTALSQQAAAAFDRHFAWALAHCFAPQKTEKGA